MVIMKAVVGRAGADYKQNEEEQRLCLFGNNISVDIYYALLG